MSNMNIYMCGVGGQGIGVLSEVMVNSALAAGYNVKSVDTHGLAQRGGIVVSHLRLGEKLFTPRIQPGTADLVIGLERLEAMRAAVNQLKQGGTVVYYDSQMQPIHVRMGRFDYPETEDIEKVAANRAGHVERVYIDGLPDPRMQNTAVLGRLAALDVIPKITGAVIEQQLRDILKPATLEDNMDVFKRAQQAASTAG